MSMAIVNGSCFEFTRGYICSCHKQSWLGRAVGAVWPGHPIRACCASRAGCRLPMDCNRCRKGRPGLCWVTNRRMELTNGLTVNILKYIVRWGHTHSQILGRHCDPQSCSRFMGSSGCNQSECGGFDGHYPVMIDLPSSSLWVYLFYCSLCVSQAISRPSSSPSPCL